ncbi:adenosylcobinamide amidohydrolase [Natronomonas halophila]|uniref:adenosylcobinamide amidohydrolase n=1 Tax=Natronomonas halophila TaxID=2747817 RepID=UPI0015B3E36F|nr:adenosylcobinamide amidohydrolase [Natronomonas halophila]QLD86050.1 adenosylcobinamide amidohydrolase [Natronomonas halophila]
MFEYDRTDDRLTLFRPDTRWLSNGFDGGYRDADAAHNLTVPEGFDRTDLGAYAAERLGERPSGPTLLTGVSQRHARGARCGPVEAVATVGLSNPAVLPVEGDAEPAAGETMADGWRPGTVNVFVGTTRALDDGAMAGLLATAVEAKTATLLAAADVPGTTSDAVVVGSAPEGSPSAFAGSATEVGDSARACVRDAVLASLDARYDGERPPTPEEARYGLRTTREPSGFEP